VTVTWSDLGLTGRKMVRDLWRQVNLGELTESLNIGAAAWSGVGEDVRGNERPSRKTENQKPPEVRNRINNR
jgi:hypothetical protein